jgi:hypothetical protein
MKQRFGNTRCVRRDVRGKNVAQRWLVQLKKTGGIARKARRTER